MKAQVAVWVVATVLLGGGCKRKAEPAPAQSAAAVAGPTVEVTTVRVQRGAVTQQVSAPGSLVALRESHIGTEVAGRVVRVFVSEGDRVEAGAPLFQVDPAPYEMALRQAEAGVDVARAQRSQTEADLARAQTLRRQAVMAPQEFDRLVTGVAVAQAQERQATEALALARFNVGRTLVRAPYAGSVAKRLVDEGTTALVQPQTIVLVLQETGELEAEAAIPESQLALVQLGDQARLLIEGLAELDLQVLDAQEATHLPRETVYVEPLAGDVVPAQIYRRKKGSHAGKPSGRYKTVVLERAYRSGWEVYESLCRGTVDAAGNPLTFG